MRNRPLLSLCLSGALAAAAVPMPAVQAQAQVQPVAQEWSGATPWEPAALSSQRMQRTGVSFTLGLGLRHAPKYFGAGSSRLGPAGSFALDELVLPGGFGFGSRDALPLQPGFGPRGGFRYIGERRASDHPSLAGTDRIRRAVELGGGLAHVTQFGRVYGEVRRGFGGHTGWVGEVGIDAIVRPTPQLVLTAGPRANWGNARFTRTYFGVTPAESAASGGALTPWRPSGGLVSVGVEVAAQYDLGDGWGLRGRLGWEQLRGGAANSPITRQRNQYSAQLVVTRQFTLGGR